MPKAKAKVPAKRPAPKTPAVVSDAELAAAEYAASGMETVGSADLLIPRLAILQKLSPELDKTHAKYIDGAEEGDICDTGMGRVFDEVSFIPVIYRKQWIEWGEPRGSGRIIQIYTSSAILDECTQEIVSGKPKGPFRLPSGNAVVETAQFSGLFVQPSQYSKVFVALAGSQLRKARRWLNLSTSEKIQGANGQMVTAPLWWRSYILGSQPEKNAEGNWMGWTLEREDTMPEICSGLKLPFKEVMEDALAFSRAISEGHQQLNVASLAEDAEDEEVM